MFGMPALTRAEAQTRARDLTVQQYAIDLDLTRGEDVFGSVTVIRFTAPRDCDTFAELKPAVLRARRLDGAALDPALLDGNRLPLAGLTAGEHELRVEADMRYSRTGEGMHRFTDPGRRRGVRLHPAVHGRRAAGRRRLRPARPQGRLRRGGHRAAGLDGAGQRRRRPYRARPLADGHHPAAGHLLPRGRRRTLPLGAHRARRAAVRPALPPLAGRAPRPGRRRDCST